MNENDHEPWHIDGDDHPGDPSWELADQFTNLFGENDDLRGRTVAAVEERLRSGSVTSTLVELLGVGITTTAELFGVVTPNINHNEED